MKRFKAVRDIVKYYQETIKETDNMVSVWNSINQQFDFYEFIEGFWVLTD